jgi:hypothetical protein
MKTIALFLLFASFAIKPAWSQPQMFPKPTAMVPGIKNYQIWVEFYNSKEMKTGILYDIQDSAIRISKNYDSRGRHDGKFEVTTIDSKNIEVIKVRHKTSLGIGIMVGVLTGVGCGILVGYAVHNSQPDNIDSGLKNASLTVVLPVLVAGTCIGLGAALGAAKTQIPVNGSQEEFDRQKENLNKYAVIRSSELVGKDFKKLQETVSDADGNVYQLLALGGQVWMAEDLRATRYRDGSAISDINKSNAGEEKRYSWKAVTNSVSVCPEGWHVPTDAEWNSLYYSLGGANYAGSKLKEGFSVNERETKWWSSSVQDAENAKCIYLNKKTDVFMVTAESKTSGNAVRCIRDN